jgi:hypothetical protein
MSRAISRANAELKANVSGAECRSTKRQHVRSDQSHSCPRYSHSNCLSLSCSIPMAAFHVWFNTSSSSALMKLGCSHKPIAPLPSQSTYPVVLTSSSTRCHNKAPTHVHTRQSPRRSATPHGHSDGGTRSQCLKRWVLAQH